MSLTSKEYDNMVRRASPPSKSLRNCTLAFLVGGAICTLAELLTDLFVMAGLSTELAHLASTISIIFLAALLTAFQVYDNLAKFGGAGALVPITGFANSIVSPAMEYKSEGYIKGIGVQMFTIAGPVLVYGTTASVVYGLILWILRLIA